MGFCFPDTDPDRLPAAMRDCWKDGSNQKFDAFFGLFTPFMRADLARYTNKVALVDEVCAASRDEIRREFTIPEETNFDYVLLFRAIVYSHFSHTLQDRGVMKVIQYAQSPPSVGSGETGHDICIVIFEVLLSLGGDCMGKLLDLSLESGASSVAPACFAALRMRLSRLPGWPLF
jgi:hypothetical protein